MTPIRLFSLLGLAVIASGLLGGSAARAAGADTTLGRWVSVYGDPPEATDGRIRIPAIDVDAPIAARQVDAEGNSPMPLGPSDVAWYDFGRFPGLGGRPGEGRNAVFSGHVDYVARVPWAGVRYAGPGVFARLGELATGDRIEVVREGRTLTYVVSWAIHVDADQATWGEYWKSSVAVDSITLYTCAGAFDAASISYSDRIVVRAERLAGTPRLFPQTFGDYTAGVSGTNLPAALARAQPFEVRAVWKADPSVAGGYRFWAPGAPAFLDTLTGHLKPEDYVILRIR